MRHIPTWNFIQKSTTIGNDQWEALAEWETTTLLILCQGNKIQADEASFKKTRAEGDRAAAQRQQTAFLKNAEDPNPQVAAQWKERAEECAKTIEKANETIARCESVTQTLQTFRFPLKEIE